MSLDFATRIARDSIVAALDGLVGDVDGQPVTISATRYQPRTVDRWQAWPVWVSGRTRTKCLCETDWHVVLTLPTADQQTTIDAADDLISVVGDALLEAGGAIAAVRPARLIVGPDDASVPILQYEITI